MHMWQPALLVLDRPCEGYTPTKTPCPITLAADLLQELALLHMKDPRHNVRTIHHIVMAVHTIHDFRPIGIRGKCDKERCRAVFTASHERVLKSLLHSSL